MFRFKKYLSIVVLLFFFSCQSDSEEQDYNTQTVTNASPLTSYLQRVAMVKTVQDNIIDKSNYCTIKLPYTVTVNGVSIAVNTTADYQQVEDNINANTTDDDIVTINFPVTMIYYNYTQKLISDQAGFNSLIDYWNLYPDLLSKINGLNINYPITINIYNSINQEASSVDITNDWGFFSFIKNLNASQYIALSYPISITDCNNQTKSITNNLEFENEIKDVIDNCWENNITTLDFVGTITNNSWKVSCLYDNYEKSSLYSGYVFVFKSDNSVVATKDGVSVTGQWETNIVNNVRELKVNFSTELLNKLNNDWKLFEFNNSQIRLRYVTGSNVTNYLYFGKI